MALFGNLLRQEKGATSIEYGLIAAFLVLGCFTAYKEVGEAAIAKWDFIADKVTTVVTN